MPFSFGEDTSSSYDWGSLINNLVTQAGSITTAAVAGGNVASANYVAPYGAQPTFATTGTTSLTNNNLVLLAIAGVLGFVLFKKVSARRAGSRR